MKNVSPEEFVSNVLPGVIAGAEKLSAVFLTYNSLGNYVSPDEFVEPATRGLYVYVHDSDKRHTTDEIIDQVRRGYAAIENNDMDTIHQMNVAHISECQHGLSTAVSKFSRSRDALSQSEKTLVIVYAGLSVFHDSLRVARTFHQEVPNAFVVVLTCDCNLREKQLNLDSAVTKQEIQSVVVTSECGGRGPMKSFIDALINLWPVVLH